MITYQIERPDETLKEALQNKIDNLTKPKGSLGRLESLALQVGMIQRTLSPVLRRPVNVIYASDHGIADEGVSKSPKEVTRQVVYNFLNGGAGVCFLARQHGFGLRIVDAGVDFDFPPLPRLTDRKIRKGTRNFLHEAAMTAEEMDKAIRYGADIVTECHREGSNVISFGEMGIGNTAASSMWMTCLTGIPLIDCVGAGSGLDCEGVRHKYEVLSRALENYKGERDDTLEVMRHFGGYEMVMAVGGMLRAAELRMTILVDGFIMTNCVLAASRLYPEMLPYCVFGHRGDEAGHKRVLDFLGASPLLDLGLRLGEGSGAICAFPILDSAVRMLNEMHSFRQAQITKYF